MSTQRLALLERFGAMGELGARIEDHETAFSRALDLTWSDNSFQPASLFYVTCMDDRPNASKALRMPGGGMTLGFLAQFLWGDTTLHLALQRLHDRMGLFCSLHPDCLAMQGGVAVVREILANPTEEMELLQWLGLGGSFTEDVFIALHTWAENDLPDDFISSSLSSLDTKETFVGEHNPLVAVLNKTHRGRTFAYQATMPLVTMGFTAFSLDLWPARDFAGIFAGCAPGRVHVKALEALYLLMCVGFLRRVGSRHLYLDAH
jgi:hypothetical protein